MNVNVYHQLTRCCVGMESDRNLGSGSGYQGEIYGYVRKVRSYCKPFIGGYVYYLIDLLLPLTHMYCNERMHNTSANNIQHINVYVIYKKIEASTLEQKCHLK